MTRIDMKLETLVNNGPAVIFLCRAETGWPVEMVTENVSRLGYSPEDFVEGSLGYADIIYPADLEMAVSQFSAYAEKEYNDEDRGHKEEDRGHGTFTQQYRLLNKFGDVLWVEAEIQVLTEVVGNAGSFQITVFDISRWKQAEKSMLNALDTEKEFKRIINSGHAIVFLWRAEPGWPVDFVSENVSGLGYTPEDFTSRNIVYTDIIHPEDLEKVKVEVSKNAEEGRDYFSKEYRVLMKSGKVRYMDERTLIRRNEKGEVTCYQGILLDITKRKQAEELILSQNRVLERIASGASLDEVLLLLVNYAEEMKPGLLCTVMLLDREQKRLFYGACPSLPKLYSKAINGMRIKVNNGAAGTAAGTAARTGKRVIVGNIMKDPFCEECREIAQKVGLKACWAEPIFSSGGEVLGVFTIYLRETRMPREEELEFIRTNAHLAGIAIEHVQAAEALKESESRFRTIFDNINDQLYIREPDGISYMDVNRVVVDRLGYSKEEILNMEAEEIIPSNYWASVRENMQKIKAEGSRIFEAGAVCKDGTVIPLEVSARIIDYGGKRTILSVSRDITERKKAEAAQRLNESRLETLVKLEQMAGASLKEITDFAREEAVRLTGSKLGYLAFMDAYESTLVMQSWSDSVMEECSIEDKQFIYPVKSMGLWGEAARQRKPIITNNYPAPNPLKKGCPKNHVHLTRHLNIPVFDGKRIVAVAGVGNKGEDYDESDVRQLTLLMQGMWQLIQRKQLEEALRTYSEELSKANEELGSMNMIKSEFMEEVMFPEKAEYEEIMDFETLYAIDSQQQKAVNTFIHHSEKLRRLVDSLLYQSLEKAGKIEYSFEETQLRDILSDAFLNNIFLIDEKGLEVEKEVPASLPEIKGDREKLTVLFTALVDYALKFIPQGGKLVLEVKEEEDNVHIVIVDSGKGISKELIPYLFDRLYQVNDSVSRRYQGLESGLYICKDIVDAHKGEIWFESEDVSGTLMHVKLPK
ncbi:TPA: GAF domain-containing protein [Methanosarcinaceae archaeon]|nr:GAF domain-containing protein [Methanosarcinaceae archaeon]